VRVDYEIENAAEFDTKIAETPAVLVEFVGPDCIICRNIAPMLSVIGREFSSQLDLVSVDLSRLAALAERFSIRSLPTMILFVQGREVVRRSGFTTAAELRAWINSALQGMSVS